MGDGSPLLHLVELSSGLTLFIYPEPTMNGFGESVALYENQVLVGCPGTGMNFFG